MAANLSAHFDFLTHCLVNEMGSAITFTFILCKVSITLPFCTLVLFLGLQRRRRSLPSTSHQDFFAYHAVVLELLFILAAVFMFSGQHAGLVDLTKAGMLLTAPVFPGEMSFHLLTCIECYVAVGHAVAYRKLRRSDGVMIRNASVGCVWLLCCGWVAVVLAHFPDIPFIPYFCILVSFLAIISFCSLSVLCFLIGPQPGEGGGDRQRAGQTKQRACHTLTAIMVVLLVCFLGMLVTFALAQLLPLSFVGQCAMLLSGNWCSLPSSLVLPLLYLHRAGKLPCGTGRNH